MIQRTLSVLASAASVAVLSACSTVPSGHDSYGRPTGDYPRPPTVSSQPAPAYGQNPSAQSQYGSVRTIDVVPVASRPSGAGAVLGAVLGAVVGNQIGGGSGRVAATVAGAVGGGVAGHAIEGRTRKDNEVYRVAVRFDDGTYREFDFQRIDELRVGDRIRWDGSQFQRL